MAVPFSDQVPRFNGCTCGSVLVPIAMPRYLQLLSTAEPGTVEPDSHDLFDYQSRYSDHRQADEGHGQIEQRDAAEPRRDG
jgi:hypothetical protein